MSTPSPQSGPLAFGDFLDHLRRQGFNIGVDHHLRLQRLLTQLGGRCAPQDLKTLLCPVFATSEKEQQLFHRAFDSYFELFQVPAETEGKSSSFPGADAGSEEPAVAPGKARWRSPLGYTLLAVLLVTLAVLIARNPEVGKWFDQSPTPAPLQTQEPPLSPEPSTSTSTAPSMEVSPSEAISPPSMEQTPQQPAQSATDFIVEYRNAIRVAAVAIPLLCFLIYELIRYRRRKLILERARGRKPPRAWPIVAPSPELKDYRSERFYRAARGLRRRQVGEFHRLDVARTIAATIEARGYPNFRYRPDSRVPEYLILIDRASWRDHRAALFDALARAMEREGIFVQRYFYEGDPRICTDDATLRSVSLTDLQKKYPAHRLLIFGDGERLIDPVSGKLASWAALLLEWPDRALLTTEPRRGLREKTLADHFILLPATLEGLSELAERFDMPTATEFDSWDQYDEPLPPDPEGPVEVKALRGYLGEDAFQWLCACAVYPELHWELTLYLGSLPCMGAGLISEQYLLRLIRLPWFRTGSMPDELRLQLISELEPQRERAVRSAIIELLEKNPAPHGSFAADARRLEIAAQRSWLSRDNRKELRQEVEEIRKFPPSDVAHDYALVRFLESAPSSRLAMLLPRRLRKTFYTGGVPAFGVKNSLRLVATLATVTAIWFGATRLLPVTPASDIEEVIGFELDTVSIPGGTFRMGRDYEALAGEEIGWAEQQRPAHEVSVGSFQMDRTEVTNAEYAQFVQENKYPAPSDWTGGKPPVGQEKWPVRNVSLNDAQVFAAWRSKRDGLFYRLPTEAEWEFAARGQGSSRFPWGADWAPGHANLEANAPQPVGSYPQGASRFGVLDLIGNVGEWTASPASVYPGNTRLTEENVKASCDGCYVVRGGSYASSPQGQSPISVTVRGFFKPSYKYPTVGFRLVRSVPSSVVSPSSSPAGRATSPSPSPTGTPPPLARFSVSPRSLDFGTVSVPAYTAQQPAPNVARKTVTVTNTGATSYTMTRVAINSGKDRVDSFTIGRNSCSGANFQPRERCSIEVIFSPKASERYSANLFINTTVGQQTVSLFGDGAFPANQEPKAPTDNEQNRQNSAGDFTLRGAFEGRVFDVDTKEPLVGARVTITNKETYISRTVSTDKAGRYYFGQLAPGIYDFTFSHAGYESSAVRDVPLVATRVNLVEPLASAGGLRKIREK